MICKVVIWRHQRIIDTYISESVWECIKWFQKEYYELEKSGECYLEVYINDVELKFKEIYHLGFYD